MAGRPTNKQMEERDHLETALAEIQSIMVDMDELSLRTQQALNRTDLVRDTLEPAVQRLQHLRESLCLVRQEVRCAWLVGQSTKQ